jgi:hypothetical protein
LKIYYHNTIINKHTIYSNECLLFLPKKFKQLYLLVNPSWQALMNLPFHKMVFLNFLSSVEHTVLVQCNVLIELDQ